MKQYRIVCYRSGKGYGLHEVFFDTDGEPFGMKKEPSYFAAESVITIRQTLTQALEAAALSVLVEPEHWPGQKPD